MSDSRESAASRTRELPPLRVHHLLAWMAVTACLSLITLRDDPGRLKIRAEMLAYTLHTAASITAVSVVLLAHWRGCRDWQPGHVLLVLQALMFAITLWWWGTPASSTFSYPFTGQLVRIQASFIVRPAVAFFMAIGLGWAWRRTPWLWLFVLTAVQPLLATVVHLHAFDLFRSTSHYASCVASQLGELAIWGVLLLTAGWCVSHDRRLRLSRHWTHWVGLAPLVVSGVLAAMSLTILLSTPPPVGAP